MSIEWKPSRLTLFRMYECMDKKKRQKYFRAASSAYISKPKVKDYVFRKFNNKCALCGTSENLQIDHIKSVHSCFKSNNINKCNTLSNLQLLCASCNASKKP